jgi:dipeptidyl aminopeptidase/acylaminoacyl peptidase
LKIRRLLSAGICYAIASVILAVGLGELAFRPLRISPTERPSAEAIATRFGAALEDASVAASDGARLQAWYARPAKSNGNAVILIHGIGDNRQGMMGFAELFLSQGYAVLVPDSRAQGTSGGGFPTYGVEEAKDVRDWFNWLQTRQHPNCVFGMGESMGAAIVLQAVKTTPFCAVVAESPFASFRQISYIRVGQIFRSGEWLGQYGLRPSVEIAFAYARLTRGVNLTAASPEQSVVGSRVPILLIHGLADENIPPHQSEIIRDHNPSNITLWEVPNAGHCGAVSVGAEEFDSRVLGWFAGHSRSRTAVPIPAA